MGIAAHTVGFWFNNFKKHEKKVPLLPAYAFPFTSLITERWGDWNRLWGPHWGSVSRFLCMASSGLHRWSILIGSPCSSPLTWTSFNPTTYFHPLYLITDSPTHPPSSFTFSPLFKPTNLHRWSFRSKCRKRNSKLYQKINNRKKGQPNCVCDCVHMHTCVACGMFS